MWQNLPGNLHLFPYKVSSLKRRLQWQLTSGRASSFNLYTMRHLHLQHFHSAGASTEEKRHYLAELPLSTFAKRTISLSRTAWSYNFLNTSKNKHRHRAAASGTCCKEGHGEVRAKLLVATDPWEGLAQPPALLAHTVELPPIEKRICVHFCY